MRSRTLLSFSALAGLVVLAFGSGDMSSMLDNAGSGGVGGMGGMTGHAANEPACRKYIEAFNALDCMGTTMDADQVCGSVGMSPIDMTGYYECMAKGYACKDGLPDTTGAQACTMPSM
jgi:hypothetical protein